MTASSIRGFGSGFRFCFRFFVCYRAGFVATIPRDKVFGYFA